MHQSKSNQNPAAAQSGHINDNELFDERTEKIIRLTALRLVRSGRFPQHENDDIKQELRLSLWRQMPKFNPALSSRYTYANMVCNQTANTMCRNRARSLAKGTCEASLEQEVGQGDYTLGDCISSDEYRIAIGCQNRTDIQYQELKDTVAAALAQLPVEDADICRQLMEGASLRAIARSRQCPFTTLLNRFHHHIAPKVIRLLGGVK